jgi:hypothetical protein
VRAAGAHFWSITIVACASRPSCSESPQQPSAHAMVRMERNMPGSDEDLRLRTMT